MYDPHHTRSTHWWLSNQQSPCNTVSISELSAFLMEGSELSAFLIWKVLSSVPSLYGRFWAQCLPYGRCLSPVPLRYRRHSVARTLQNPVLSHLLKEGSELYQDVAIYKIHTSYNLVMVLRHCHAVYVCNTHAVTITVPIQLVAVGCVVEGLCRKMASEGLCRKMASEDGFRRWLQDGGILGDSITHCDGE